MFSREQKVRIKGGKEFMLHTAHFYIDLAHEELCLLEKHIGSSYEKIGSKIGEYASGFTTWVTKHYGIRLHFEVDFIKLLGTPNIKEDDCPEVEQRIRGYLFYLFADHDYYDRVVLIRIDYRLDVRMPKSHRKTILFLYKKTSEKYRHQHKYTQYDTTIYYNSKSIQGTCYDKELSVSAENRDIETYEVDVLRFEVRLLNRHLKYMKYRKGKEKWLEEYFQEALYVKYMEQYLGVLLFKGNYYKITKAKKIINDSPLKEKEKDQLLEFLRYISRNGIQIAKNKYTSHYFKKHLYQLEILKINPILIPKNRKDFPSFMDNPFSIRQ